MKKFVCTLIFCALSNYSFAQNQWFKTYTDSIALVKDANLISEAFIADVKTIKPNIQLSGKTIVDTSPYLIYYELAKKVRLSFGKTYYRN